MAVMRHGVWQSCRVAGMCCARKVAAHECQMGHEQPSQQRSKATEHDSKLSLIDKVGEVSRVRLGSRVIPSSQRGVGNRRQWFSGRAVRQPDMGAILTRGYVVGTSRRILLSPAMRAVLLSATAVIVTINARICEGRSYRVNRATVGVDV